MDRAEVLGGATMNNSRWNSLTILFFIVVALGGCARKSPESRHR